VLFSLFCVLGLILWFVEIGIREASIPNMSPVFYIVCSAYQLVMWPSGGLGFVKSPAHSQRHVYNIFNFGHYDHWSGPAFAPQWSSVESRKVNYMFI